MKQKKNSSVKVLLFALIALVMGIAAFVLIVTDIDWLFGQKPRNINEYVMDDGVAPPKDEHISIDVDAVLGNYAETKHRINGFIPAGTDQHYIIWLDDNGAISLTVKNKKMIDKLNEICDDTWDYIDGVSDFLPDGFTIEGQVSTLDPEVLGYYNEYLEEMGFTTSGYPIYTVTIDTTATKLKSWCLIGFSLVCMIICIIAMVNTIRAIKREKQYSQYVGSQTDTYGGYNAAYNGNNSNPPYSGDDTNIYK